MWGTGKMELDIVFEQVAFNDSPLGNSKPCVFVMFPNCISTKTRKPFKWMPTYKQLEQIKAALDKIEKISWQPNNKT